MYFPQNMKGAIVIQSTRTKAFTRDIKVTFV